MFVRHYCWLIFRIYMYTYSCNMVTQQQELWVIHPYRLAVIYSPKSCDSLEHFENTFPSLNPQICYICSQHIIYEYLYDIMWHDIFGLKRILWKNQNSFGRNWSTISQILISHRIIEEYAYKYLESRFLRGTIYQPLRSGRIWHKVNF